MRLHHIASALLIVTAGLAAEENLVANGTMEAGAAQPEGWSLWQGGGTVSLSKESVDGGTVLRLRSSADGSGSASAKLSQLAPRLRIRARLRCDGTPSDRQLALQCFDAAGTQVGWIWLATPGASWAPIDTTVDPPREATGAQLVAMLSGAGAMEIDDVVVVRAKH